MEQIGILKHDGKGHTVVGLCCKDTVASDDTTTKIFHANVYPYRQDCSCCGKLLVEGRSDKWPVLFDGKA